MSPRPEAPDAGAPKASPSEDDMLRELHDVLGTALAMAQEQLENNGGFLPYGVTLADDGELRLVLVAPPEGEAGSGEDDDELDGDLDAEAMLTDLVELLRQGRGAYRAVAFASDVTLPDHGTDGIHAAAEHRGGGLLAAVLPYEMTANGYLYGSVEPDGHEARVFTD
ncbi:hypothetical protein SPF06_16905 [Sinomonas sp. JGH33]|uniref:Histidine kinase n=1 Tax=Sinomonas terricola TaxID=3110330 RepID=A0ABU5T9T9_9MICC|nr:hypothetical protein [Sinomonas sp. JGH33]MEA5456415.1 hypothetical protein [Sinomonas sp. JGH33]